MDQFIQFVMHHWLLSGLFVAILIVIFIEEARSKGLGGTGIVPAKLVQLHNSGEAVVVDVRDADAFQEGHIVDSTNIPMGDFADNIKKLDKYKSKTVVLVCQNGQKAGGAMSQLKKAGFENVFILTSGINAWKTAGMPLSKKKKNNGKG